MSTKKKALCIINTKGGTGKTLISLNLGKRLTKFGKTALLDVDLDNSSFSQFTGIDGVIEIDKLQRFKPFEWEGMEVFSMSLVTARDQSVSMSGDRYVQIIDDVITRSAWEAKYYVFDMPGGSSDIFRSVVEVLGDILVGNVIVHQPSMVDSTRKILNLHQYLEIPVLGIIENMSYLETGYSQIYNTLMKKVNASSKIVKTKDAKENLLSLKSDLEEEFGWMKGMKSLQPFGPSTVDEIAKEYGVPVLGKIPLDPTIAHRFNEGNPFLDDSLVAPIDAAIEIFLQTEPQSAGFLSRAKDKIVDVVSSELIKVVAGLIMTINQEFDIKGIREDTGFTQEKPLLLILTNEAGSEITRIGLQTMEKGLMVIAEPKSNMTDSEYASWVEKSFEFQIVASYKTFSRIIMGKMKRGDEILPFSAWAAWLNNDLKAYGLGYAPRAVNAIRSIFENKDAMRPVQEKYGRIFERWI